MVLLRLKSKYRAVGSKYVMVRLIAYNNERAAGERARMLNKLLLRMRTMNFDDLYLKIDQKVVRLWPDQPDRLLRP